MFGVLGGQLAGVNPSGQSIKHPKAEGYNLRIGDIWFRTIANRNVPLTIGTRDSLAERQDRAGSTYENVLDIGYAWSRTDLSGGEGLDWDPREMALYQDQAALDQLRYFSSNGINVARPRTNGEQYKLQLTADSEFWAPVFADIRDIDTSSTHIYTADSTLVAQYAGWGETISVASWTVPSPVVAMAVSPNGTIMVTAENGNGYVKGPLPDDEFVEFYKDSGGKLKARGVWFEHGRFLMSVWDDFDSAVLYEVNWDGTAGEWTESKIDTASSPFWSVVESGPAVVAACGDGTIRTYTPDNSNGGTYELQPRGRTSVPEGELPILLGSNAGVLLVLTTADTDETALIGEPPVEEPLQVLRMYQAEVLDARFDFTVGQMQLRRTWVATTHEPDETRNMANTRDEVYWFVREHIDGDFAEGLWRMDVVTNGFSRVRTFPGQNLNGLLIFDSRFAGIDFIAQKVTIGNDKFIDNGWMVFPNITFGVNTPITWMASVLEVQNLADSGAQVELWRSSDPTALLDWQGPSWILVQRISNRGGTNLEVPMINVKSRTLSLQLRIFNHTEGTESPKVTRIAMRGIPSHRDLIMMVPINVSDYVSVPGRQPAKIPGLGHEIHTAILDKVGDNVQAILLDPPVVFEGVINNISEPIEYLAERGSVTRYVMVEFRGQRKAATSEPVGDAGIGLGLLGITTVGIGQTVRT